MHSKVWDEITYGFMISIGSPGNLLVLIIRSLRKDSQFVQIIFNG